jgi:hypothetical protein
MITQAVQESRDFSHIAPSEPQHLAFSRPIPPSSPATGATCSAVHPLHPKQLMLISSSFGGYGRS